MRISFPSIYTAISVFGFYFRMAIRIFFVRPALIMGSIGILLFVWLLFHPQSWEAVVADEGRRFRDAPVGMRLTEECKSQLVEGLPSYTVHQCRDSAKPLAETAQDTLAAVCICLKVLLIFSVLIECLQLLTGHRIIWPGRSVMKEGRGAVYHYRQRPGRLPEKETQPGDLQH